MKRHTIRLIVLIALLGLALMGCDKKSDPTPTGPKKPTISSGSRTPSPPTKGPISPPTKGPTSQPTTTKRPVGLSVCDTTCGALRPCLLPAFYTEKERTLFINHCRMHCDRKKSDASTVAKLKAGVKGICERTSAVKTGKRPRIMVESKVVRTMCDTFCTKILFCDKPHGKDQRTMKLLRQCMLRCGGRLMMMSPQFLPMQKGAMEHQWRVVCTMRKTLKNVHDPRLKKEIEANQRREKRRKKKLEKLKKQQKHNPKTP